MLRLDSARSVVLAGGSEDPLDNDEQLQDQMDSLPYLCRFKYEDTAKYLTSLMDSLVAAYLEAASGQPSEFFQHVLGCHMCWDVAMHCDQGIVPFGRR